VLFSGSISGVRSIEPGVVASILEDALDTTARSLAAVPEGCTLVEIRADRLHAADVESLVPRSSFPVVVTVRDPAEGGRFDGTTEERRAILEAALRSGAAFVDVEWSGPLRDLALGPGSDRVVLSDHGAPCDASVLRSRYREMAATPAARLKIVPRASGPLEACVVRDLLGIARAEGRQLASFTLGHGSFTRIFALAWGSWGTYGAVSRRTAPGQHHARDLLGAYGATRLAGSTRRHALVGRGVDGSPSPALHDAAYRDAGIDAVLVPIEIESVEDLFALLEALQVRALAVTIPLKEAVARRVRLLDPVARRAIAVNTVRLGPGAAEGFNTDGPAARELIRAHVDPRGSRVAVVGAGGTGRAVAAALVEAGARVTLHGRDRERVAGWAERIGATASDLASLEGASWDVLVQATPLGRTGERVLEAGALRGRVVLDAVYGPDPTPLVRDARVGGLATIDGFDLLVEQAALQIGILTGRTADRRTLDAALRAWRESRPRLDGDPRPE
jgi:3-dehydroquinate dehydratase/shikimate dehydrogenase